MTPRDPTPPPGTPKAETAEGHTGRDDVSHGLNSNLDADMGSSGADRAATEEIVEQRQPPEEEG